MYKEEKEIWLKAFCAAISGAANTVGDRFMEQDPDDQKNLLSEHDIVEDDCDIAAMYADVAVAKFNEKFNGC